MAKVEQIEITISSEGEIKAEKTCGEGGASCLDELDGLLDGVGKKTKETKKAEFYKKTTVKRTVGKKYR